MGIRSSQRMRRRSRSEVAKTLKLKAKELGQFEKEGLFRFSDRKKSWIDDLNFERLRVAVQLKRELGVNIPGIDVILAMREKMAQMKSEMNEFLVEVRKDLSVRLARNSMRIDSEIKKKR